jgi:hypothetical protein
VKKPVSKFAFQVHNLQRYSEVCWATLNNIYVDGTSTAVGLCTLNQVDP